MILSNLSIIRTQAHNVPGGHTHISPLTFIIIALLIGLALVGFLLLLKKMQKSIKSLPMKTIVIVTIIIYILYIAFLAYFYVLEV